MDNTATIKEIRIDKDTGWIVMEVICNKCKKENSHAISYISRETGDELIIDFAGTTDWRECENYIYDFENDNVDDIQKCGAIYNLCNIVLPK